MQYQAADVIVQHVESIETNEGWTMHGSHWTFHGGGCLKKQAIVTLHCMNKQEYAGHLCSDPKVRENFASCCQLHRGVMPGC